MARFWNVVISVISFASLILAAPLQSRSGYHGEVVLRFNITGQAELKELTEAAESLYLDVWDSTRNWVDVRLSKDAVPALLSLLPDSLQHAHTPLIHDLAQVIAESDPSEPAQHWSHLLSSTSRMITQAMLNRPHHESDDATDLFFREYRPMSAISTWMELMAALSPDHTQTITIGSSYEGRSIPALRVSSQSGKTGDSAEPRKMIIVSGGSHAREWISTSTVNFVASQFITRYGKYPGLTRLVDEFDWVFIPTLNPDGYIYTWEHDRLWRKNRQPTDLQFCHGLDLDRAWGYQWDGDSTRSNPCSESYAGIGPFEAVEAKSLADWVKNETQTNNVQLAVFLDLHSYSQQILYPYSYSCSDLPNGLENLQELAYGMQRASRLTHNQFYSVQSACESSFPSSSATEKSRSTLAFSLGGGSAIDYFYETFHVKFTYQIKLRDTGSYGFLLPKSNIVPTGEEIYNSILWAIGNFISSNKAAIRDPRDQVTREGGSDINWGRELLGGAWMS